MTPMMMMKPKTDPSKMILCEASHLSVGAPNEPCGTISTNVCTFYMKQEVPARFFGIQNNSCRYKDTTIRTLERESFNSAKVQYWVKKVDGTSDVQRLEQMVIESKT